MVGCLVPDGYEEPAPTAEPDEEHERVMELGFSRYGRDAGDGGVECCLYEQIPMPALRIGYGSGGLEGPEAGRSDRGRVTPPRAHVDV